MEQAHEEAMVEDKLRTSIAEKTAGYDSASEKADSSDLTLEPITIESDVNKTGERRAANEAYSDESLTANDRRVIDKEERRSR